MKSINGLSDSLNVHFGWNKARMNCFVRMLLGLFATRTVNLQRLSLAFASEAQVSSRYRRLQRFFAYFEIDWTQLAVWIFQLFFADQKQFYLIIDRTNWFWGQKKINVFVLAVAYEGLAIPLFWTLLPKAGSSNYREQKALLSQFFKNFEKKAVAGILADREFASGKLMKWLNKRKIPFYIRIKENSQVKIRNKKFKNAKQLFNHLNPRSTDYFAMSIWLFGAKVYLAAGRSEKGDLMIVATNRMPKNAIAVYLRRWEIENLFQGLKGRGFSFEETHITHPERIAKLMALLAVGFVWAHKVGEWQANKKTIILKQFHNQQRPQYTFFRYGLDYLQEVIFSFYNKNIRLHECMRIIIFPARGT